MATSPQRTGGFTVFAAWRKYTPPFSTRFLAHMSSRSSGISIGSAVLQGSPVPSRQTDHGTCDVSSDKPHLGDAYDAAQNKATILHEILLVSYDTGLDKA